MADKMKNAFNVLRWEFNTDKIEHFDVLPGFRESLRERKARWAKASKSKRFKKYVESGLVSERDVVRYHKYPETEAELADFIKSDSMHRYWAKCEHEMIVHGWPVKKDDYKIDVHEQVVMNLPVIARILWEEISAGKSGKTSG